MDWANPVLAEPIRIENGHALIPARPGSGIEWDEDAVTAGLESAMVQLGVMPFDENDLPPEDPRTF